jgi:hypothetical protein
MKRDLISRITRLQFREWLVDWTLREIDDLFASYGFEQAYIPPDAMPSGQRRSLVECSYEGVDWTDPGHIARILRIFEDVIFKVEDRSLPCFLQTIRYLERDGYTLEGNHLVARSGGKGLSPAVIASLGSQASWRAHPTYRAITC